MAVAPTIARSFSMSAAAATSFSLRALPRAVSAACHASAQASYSRSLTSRCARTSVRRPSRANFSRSASRASRPPGTLA